MWSSLNKKKGTWKTMEEMVRLQPTHHGHAQRFFFKHVVLQDMKAKAKYAL
jgi:hypothetical protein